MGGLGEGCVLVMSNQFMFMSCCKREYGMIDF